MIAYCRRRGSQDAEALAAETMAIAWRRLDELSARDCRPWLIVTARNLLLEEHRDRARRTATTHELEQEMELRDDTEFDFEIHSLDPRIDYALSALSAMDREALLLVAWEDLNPARAAEALGIRPTAFRVRLHRARRRFNDALEQSASNSPIPSQCPLEENA